MQANFPTCTALRNWPQRTLILFLSGCVVLIALTFICFQLHAVGTVASLLYMVIIVLLSLRGRLVPAILLSLVAVICLDYFFLKPGFRLTLTESLDVVALVAYLGTAVVVTGLLSRLQNSFNELRCSEARLIETNESLRIEISERQQAQESLRRSEAFLAQGQRISHTGCWRWQVATGSVYWSEEHFRIFGYDPETDKPSYWRFMERIHPEDRAPFEELLNQAVRNKSDFENHYRIVLPDGSTKFLRSVGQALVSSSGGLEFIGTVMDVTDLKRVEEMQIAIAQAKSAEYSAVLEERNELAAEIHDTLAQSFTGISMQLEVAAEQLVAKKGDPLGQIQLANETAIFGLAEARRSIFSLRSGVVEQSGLSMKLRGLVERSNVAGRLRCDFRSDHLPEESLPPRMQHELLRFAQEAISNAVRHAKPTVVKVTLRWESPNLILTVKDNGSGFSTASLNKGEGFGLTTMRTRAARINGKLDIHTAPGHGTTILLTTPISA